MSDRDIVDAEIARMKREGRDYGKYDPAGYASVGPYSVHRPPAVTNETEADEIRREKYRQQIDCMEHDAQHERDLAADTADHAEAGSKEAPGQLPDALYKFLTAAVLLAIFSVPILLFLGQVGLF